MEKKGRIMAVAVEHTVGRPHAMFRHGDDWRVWFATDCSLNRLVKVVQRWQFLGKTYVWPEAHGWYAERRA